jgi:hypothetical protein
MRRSAGRSGGRTVQADLCFFGQRDPSSCSTAVLTCSTELLFARSEFSLVKKFSKVSAFVYLLYKLRSFKNSQKSALSCIYYTNSPWKALERIFVFVCTLQLPLHLAQGVCVYTYFCSLVHLPHPPHPHSPTVTYLPLPPKSHAHNPPTSPPVPARNVFLATRRVLRDVPDLPFCSGRAPGNGGPPTHPLSLSLSPSSPRWRFHTEGLSED